MTCELLGELLPVKPKGVDNYNDLIRYVKDRSVYNARYAIGASKIQQELDRVLKESFETGIRKTVQ